MLSELELRRLADEFGTPLYAFDARDLAPRAARLRSALPGEVELCYAVKANTFVTGAISPLVSRLEACSPGEQRICRALGVPAGRVVVSGVSKDRGALDEALAAPELPAAVTIESAAQLKLVRDVAEARGRRAPVLLRLSSGNQFGVDRGELVRLAREAARDARLELRGVQFFSGTQKRSPGRLRREVAAIDGLMLELAGACGRELPEVEYGPGLPVAYFEGDELDEEALLAALGEALSEMSCRARVILELGRSLVAGCGTYLTRVTDAKEVMGERYAIVDGGIHQLVYYGQSLAMRRPPVRLLRGGAGDEGDEGDEPAAGEKDLAAGPSWNVCGSLCTVNDILVKRLPLAGLAPGSVLAFGLAGAYCATEGAALFLSRDLPRVVLVGEDGRPALVREGLRTDPVNMPVAARG